MKLFFIELCLSLANKKCVWLYYTHLADNHWGPGLLLIPVMGTCRGDRVHLSKQIDLISDIQANGFVAPALGQCNTGKNDMGGTVTISATQLLWELVLQELQKARVMVMASLESPN